MYQFMEKRVKDAIETVFGSSDEAKVIEALMLVEECRVEIGEAAKEITLIMDELQLLD